MRRFAASYGRDTGAGYETFLRQLAASSGIPTPTRAELARLARKHPKTGSNDDWTHPQDPDAKITKMKDGRTRLAHTAEHTVDLETGAVVGTSVQDADAGDTQTMIETRVTAAEQVDAIPPPSPRCSTACSITRTFSSAGRGAGAPSSRRACEHRSP